GPRSRPQAQPYVDRPRRQTVSGRQVDAADRRLAAQAAQRPAPPEGLRHTPARLAGEESHLPPPPQRCRMEGRAAQALSADGPELRPEGHRAHQGSVGGMSLLNLLRALKALEE